MQSLSGFHSTLWRRWNLLISETQSLLPLALGRWIKMPVHEKGASFPLSLSTVTKSSSSSVALICMLSWLWQSQQRCCSPLNSALLNLLFHFHHTNKQRGSLDGRHSLLLEVFHPPRKKWTGSTCLGSGFWKCMHGSWGSQTGAVIFICPLLPWSRKQQNARRRSGAGWMGLLEAGWPQGAVGV